MRGQGSEDQRSVTIFMSDEAYGWLVAEARLYNRTPSARAAELFHTALVAQRGPSGERMLDDLVRRMNAKARSSTTLSQPPTPSTAPEERATLPPLPMIRMAPAPIVPEPKPALLSEVQYAALSPRGRALRDIFSLSCVEAAILHALLADGQFLPQQIMEMIPELLRPSTLNSLQASVSAVRNKTQLGFDHLRHVRGGGYTITSAGRTAILARIGATV